VSRFGASTRAAPMQNAFAESCIGCRREECLNEQWCRGVDDARMTVKK